MAQPKWSTLNAGFVVSGSLENLGNLVIGWCSVICSLALFISVSHAHRLCCPAEIKKKNFLEGKDKVSLLLHPP